MHPSHSLVTAMASAMSSLNFAESSPSPMAALCSSAYANATPGIASCSSW